MLNVRIFSIFKMHYLHHCLNDKYCNLYCRDLYEKQIVTKINIQGARLTCRLFEEIVGLSLVPPKHAILVKYRLSQSLTANLCTILEIITLCYFIVCLEQILSFKIDFISLKFAIPIKNYDGQKFEFKIVLGPISPWKSTQH